MLKLFKKTRIPVREFTFFLVEPVHGELDFLKDGDVVRLEYDRNRDRLLVCREGPESDAGRIGYVPRKYQHRLLRAIRKKQDIEVLMKQVYNGDKFELSCRIRGQGHHDS